MRTAESAYIQFAVVKVQDRGDVFQREQLGDIDYRSAADGNDALVFAFYVFVDGFRHIVGRFAQTVFFLKNNVAAKVEVSEIGMIDIFVGYNQISCADMEFLREFLPCGKRMDAWFDQQLSHGVLLDFCFL
jgi:hypothetical protein